ncbi:MAG: right-handed parallel beta-helix repeat-containing protein [Candidatus Methanospirare jalkutatii]|nr:right-handed parallel beta-helix repeat-containing protein [Candidatus Methanospirare jalkutatii]
MRRKAVKFVFLAFAFLVLTAFASVSAAKTIYVPDDYARIQWAVDSASIGDTIIVRDGTYYENVVVNKKLTIKSENGSAYCIVDGSGSTVFTLEADGIRIEGFSITGGSDGIYIRSNNNSISNNTISSNNYGIVLGGNNSSISNNLISSNNDYGIVLGGNNNSISNNIISNNNRGIDLEGNNNSISNNIISNNGCGIMFGGNNNSISNNIISNNNGGGIYFGGNNNSISNNLISSNTYEGIELWEGNNNSISENNISNNYCGIYLYDSNNNSISKNNIGSNNWYGIYLANSNNNIIYLNNFINNTYNAFSYDSTNIWNSTEKITYTYRGSKFENYMGNYWDDYKGSDANGDGIGDMPYSIDSDKDYYPLMRPFEYYFAPEEPKVSVSTDKYEYRAGDVMLINITFENPTDERKSVKFLWRLDIPDYNLSFIVINNKSLSLPPEFKKTFVISWRLPKLGASFNASWYVALYDGVISEDTADWRYIGAKKKGGEREIARDIAEYLGEIERSALQSAKLIKSER